MYAPDHRTSWRFVARVALAGIALAGSFDLPVLADPGNAQMAGNAEAGGRIALQGSGDGVPACTGCHGPHGEGMGSFPHLAGTGQAYLQAQLDAFADGTRRNPIMGPLAQKLSAAQRADVARYFSTLPGVKTAPDSPPEPAPSQTGAWLAERGRWQDQLPACSQCHGPGGVGVGSHFPPLAGQPADYLREQLRAWKASARPAGPLALMPAVAARLSDQDIEAVAQYYAHLGSAGGHDVTADTGTQEKP